MRLVHNIEFIWTLEELVGLGTHGVFRNENKILGAQSFLGSNHQRPSAPLDVRCHGKDTQNAVNLLLREIVLRRRSFECVLMMSCAQGHTVNPSTSTPTRCRTRSCVEAAIPRRV